MCAAPAVAYGSKDVYRDGIDTTPRSDESYRHYRKVGLLRIETGKNLAAARAEARALYGKQTDVFLTARFWVAFHVE